MLFHSEIDTINHRFYPSEACERGRVDTRSNCFYDDSISKFPNHILNENLDCDFEISSTAIIPTKKKASV